MENTLQQASPIFLQRLENTLNVQAGFRRDFTIARLPHKALVRITARSFYRLYVNGQLAMHGPARTAHGHLRVDEVDILRWLTPGCNCLAVETTASVGCLGGYSNDCTAESSMLLAGLWLDDAAVLYSDESWDALRLTQRAEYSEKISHCRQNAEIYRLDAAYTAWRTGTPQSLPALPWQKAARCTAPMPVLLPRRMPLPTLEKQGKACLTAALGAAIDRGVPCASVWFEKQYADYYAKLTERPMLDYVQTVEHPLPQQVQATPCAQEGVVFSNVPQGETVCALFDFGELRLGFLGLTVHCETPCLLDVVHLEFQAENEEKSACLGATNPVTRLHLPAGTWQFLTMEPALARYVRVYFRPADAQTALGCCSVQDLHIREYCYPDTGRGSFHCSDEEVNRLYAAAYRTLRLNTLDIFMDCPERERGGWLCDSFWTARAAAMLLGDLSVEKAFLENFLLAPYGDGIGSPNNFFPEVYPGNKLPGAPSITTWSFWLMLELAEYVERSGDLALALQHSGRVEAFVEGAARYVGPSGLLENLPFIFIDWSQSNDSANTQPISTAANALYARMLQRLGQLYRRADWLAAGERVRGILRQALLQSNMGDFRSRAYFPDALKPDGNGGLKMIDRSSEACQYTILWAELFDKEEIPAIVKNVCRRMGPAPVLPHDPLVGIAELFIGLCIRQDLLAKWGESETLLRELRALYLPQLAEGPGTLWENRSLNNSSRCHGFNAHVGVLLLRELLGLDIPQAFDLDTRRALTQDEQRARMQRPAHLCGLRWMRGVVPTPFGLVSRAVSAQD